MKKVKLVLTVKMARQLRKELESSGNIASIKLRLYEAHELLLIQHKSTVEQAVDKFTKILDDERDSVAALLGLSHALRLLKQDAKDRAGRKTTTKVRKAELVFKTTQKLGLRSYELPEAWHSKLRHARYVVLAVLVGAFFFDSLLGERLAEVEPFKSTFLVPAWERSAGFLGWWLLLLGLSTFMYRPFCRYVCPLGGGLALFGSFRRSGPRRRRFCTSCKLCTKGCEPRAIRPDGTIDSRECLSCMECEANYRDPGVCPPLIAVRRLEVGEFLDEVKQEKLERLKRDLERV